MSDKLKGDSKFSFTDWVKSAPLTNFVNGKNGPRYCVNCKQNVQPQRMTLMQWAKQIVMAYLIYVALFWFLVPYPSIQGLLWIFFWGGLVGIYIRDKVDPSCPICKSHFIKV
ncbi:MAG: hypothetical protein WC821_01140 [archaeon]|jgi:hypothetical protein